MKRAVFLGGLSLVVGCNFVFGIEDGQSGASGTGGATSSSSSTASSTSTSGSGGTGGGPGDCPVAKIPPCHVGDAGGALCDPIQVSAPPADHAHTIGLLVIGDDVYWASGDGKVTVATYDGTPVGAFGTGNNSGWLATDGKAVLYTDWVDGRVRGVKLDAGHTTFDVAAPSSGAGSGAGHMAVHGDMVYWMTVGTGKYQILAASLVTTQVYGTLVADKFDEGNNFAVSMGVAADDAHVYWTDEGKVLRLTHDKLGVASAIETFAVDPGAGDVIVDADRVYWTSFVGVSSKKLDGTGLIVLPDSGDSAHTLLLDGAWLYWTQAGGRVLRAKRGGGPQTAEVVVIGPPNAHGLAIDCGAVYWSTFSYNNGTVYKVQKPQ